jgi:D-glycero-alpha-D-manno-heptose-7-phosphate kinase
LVISRTPYRISFFGGSTDYPSWYLKNGGQVLSTTINKYCYITCRYLPPFFEHRIRVVYSRIENCKSFDEIQHPSVRETLRFLNLDRGLEVHHDGDLPARSGMGSSSCFTVGFLHALYALTGIMPSKHQLATESIHIEQDLIKETVGSQDQVSAAYGGLNHIIFNTNGDISIRPVTIPKERLAELSSHLMLFYTGIKRTASDIASTYVEDLASKGEYLRPVNELVGEALTILCSNRCICNFGELLHKTWMLKRNLSAQISNGDVDELYERARANGAIGGKIMGAGGGGFLVLFVPPSAQARVRKALQELFWVPFRFESAGSQIIFYEPGKEDYAAMDMDRRHHSIRPFREHIPL